MEQRSCSNLHLINAIKGNLVSKLRNVDVKGKPALVFKTVKEIMEAEDARRVQPSTSKGTQCLDLRVSCARVKVESYRPPQVERSVREINPKEIEIVCRSGDDETGSDLDDDNYGKMTLKQLKEKFRTKKRKCANSVDFDQCSKAEPEEGDSDLNEPLSSLKLKLPKPKKKCVRAAFQSPKGETLIKSERPPDSEMQFQGDLPSLIQVKPGVLDPVIKDCGNIIPSVDYSQKINQSNESSVTKAISDGDPTTAECQNSKSMLCGEQYQSCSNNEVSYDHLEDVKPISLPFSRCEDTMDADGQAESCQQFLDLPLSECEAEQIKDRPLLITLPTKDDNSYMNGFSRCFREMHELVEQTSCNHAVPVSDLVVDDHISGKDLYHGSNSLLFTDDAKKNLASDHQINATSSPPRTFSTSWNLPPCLNSDDDLYCGRAGQKQPLVCSSPDGVKANSKPRNHLFLLVDKSTLDEDEQNRKFVATGEEKHERNSPSENQNCDDDEKQSISDLVQPPERLLLTRKVISPTSQERLSLAMSSTDSYINKNSKGNPCLSDQNENKGSLLGSDVKHGNVAGNPKGSGVVDWTKASPTRTLKKSKNDARRNSTSKGNIEGPRLSRSLPSFSTGCTSLQRCSESAIAFSRRQMQDIESLALKLTSELKYMKEIVEEKMLFEAYRNVSIKNDADEVKDAITNAMKVEETARKWLSMMARDCNRFCKIMSLTQNGTAPATTNGGVPKEKKKITFADEAGGMLCHVKVFGNDTTLEYNSEKQKTQTI